MIRTAQHGAMGTAQVWRSSGRLTPSAGQRRATRIALIYSAIAISVSMALFVASYLRFASSGVWLIGEFEEAPGGHVYATHTGVGLVMLAALFSQLSMGVIIRSGRARFLASYHRWLGRAFVVCFILFAAQGTYISFRAGIWGQNLHTTYGFVTILIVAVGCGYALVDAALKAREGDIAGHIDRIVLFSVMLSPAGFVRFFAKGSELAGYFNVEYFWHGRHVLTVYMVDWGCLGSAVAVFVLACAYVWQTGSWVRNKSMVILSSLFLLAAPLVILSSYVDPLKLTERDNMIKTQVRFGEPAGPDYAR